MCWFHMIRLCLLFCNSSSVITSLILLNLREVFLIYCINCGKCKRYLIRNLAFSGDVKLMLFLSALTSRTWCRNGQCTLCFPLLSVAAEPQYWEVLEHCRIHLYTAQHSQFCWACAWDVGKRQESCHSQEYRVVTCPVGQFSDSCTFLTHRMGSGEALRLVTPEPEGLAGLQ